MSRLTFVKRTVAAHLFGPPNHFRSVGTPRVPDFFGIGSEKAGTTWLWNTLMAHPKVGVPAIKEMRHFNLFNNYEENHYAAIRKFLENPRGTSPYQMERLSNELRLFYGGRKGYLHVFGGMTQGIVGEITPQYCILPMWRIRQMKALAPNAKIIYMLRDPVDRTLSGARMVAKFHEDSFTERRIRAGALRPRQIRMSDADRHLRRYEKVFGKDNILTLFYEDISTRPQEVIDEVSAFLGVETVQIREEVLSKKVNAGRDYAPSDALLRDLYKRLTPIYDRLETRFPERVKAWRSRYDG